MQSLPQHAFVEMLYAVVVGIGFSDFARSDRFQAFVSLRITWRDVAEFSLFLGGLLFLLSDYTVYSWLRQSIPTMYHGRFGVCAFAIDLILLWIHYIIICIACDKFTVRRVETYLVCFLFWHVLVILWYACQTTSNPQGSSWMNVPYAHILRSLIYLSIWMLYRAAVLGNFGGMGDAFKQNGNPSRRGLMETILVAISAVVIVLNIVRFVDFHGRLSP